MAEDILDGFLELSEELNRMAKACSEKSRKNALEKGSDIIVKAARARAPIDTGLLSREGIAAEVISGEIADIGWTADAFYGRFLEMGTSKMAARPHLRPAYEAKKNQVVQVMIETLNLD